MKLQIVNTKKFIRMLFIIVIIGGIVLFIGLKNTYSKGEIKYREEYIISGDTLWSIVEKEALENDYYKNKDIRNIVQEIKQVNNLEDANLKIGQKILIPTI